MRWGGSGQQPRYQLASAAAVRQQRVQVVRRSVLRVLGSVLGKPPRLALRELAVPPQPRAGWQMPLTQPAWRPAPAQQQPASPRACYSRCGGVAWTELRAGRDLGRSAGAAAPRARPFAA